MQLDALDQFNDPKRERFRVVADIGETVLMTFTSMSKVRSYLSVNSKGGNRGDIYILEQKGLE